VLCHQPKWSSKTLFEQANKVAAAAAAAAPTNAVDAAEALVQAATAAAAAAAAPAAAADAADAADGSNAAVVLLAAAAAGSIPRASLAPIPSTIITAAGVDSHGTGSSESVMDDALVASAAPPDPCSASSRKRGSYLGRNKAKNGAKKEKLQEKKEALIGKKQETMVAWMSQMKDQTVATQKQVSTGAELSKILKDSHELAAKKEKKSDIKFMLKLAQKKGDTALFDKYMRKK